MYIVTPEVDMREGTSEKQLTVGVVFVFEGAWCWTTKRVDPMLRARYCHSPSLLKNK